MNPKLNLYVTDFSRSDYSVGRFNGLGVETLKLACPDYIGSLRKQNGNERIVAEYMRGVFERSMHGWYIDALYTSRDPAIQEVARRRFVDSITCANFFQIPRVVFHSGYRKALDGQSPQVTNEFIKTAAAFWQEFEEIIPPHISVYIENVEEERPEILAELVQSIRNPKIKCCFDIGHAHCNSDAPVEEWADALGSLIGHVHIHDNHGDRDAHLPLGQGNAPLAPVIEKILSAADKDVPFVVECNMKTSVEWLTEMGFMA